MRKLLALVIILIITAIVLFMLAFYYIDKSGHKVLRYELYINGEPYGFVNIDRYITEDKLIYRSVSEYTRPLSYPSEAQELFFKRRTMALLKYTDEAAGVLGAMRTILLKQKDGMTDLLFLEPPRFFTMKDFETGENTMVFSPLNIMLYMPIMERYNFWRKGAQFFEVMIPLDDAVPVLRDKLEVRYKEDEYIPVMGSRADAESFIVCSEALPEAKISMAKYTHRVLALEIEKAGMRFVLVSFSGGVDEKIRSFFTGTLELFRSSGRDAKSVAGPVKEKSEVPDKVKNDTDKIFFGSGDLTLSGRVWLPRGEGQHPGIILIPEDGPMKEGEYRMFASYARALSDEGYIVLVFDRPGQGKSQGDFSALDDEENIRNIISAVTSLKTYASLEEDNITLIGHRGGGYLALKGAEGAPEVFSCIVIDMPLGSVKADVVADLAKERLHAALKERGLGPFDETYMTTITGKFEEQLADILRSGEDRSFFMGKRLPDKSYREYLLRDPYKSVLAFKKPLLMVFAKNNSDFRPKIVDALKKKTESRNNTKIAVFRDLDRYMGNYVTGDTGSGVFAPNQDVLTLISKWIGETQALYESLKAEEQIAEETAPEEGESPEPGPGPEGDEQP